MVSVNADLAKKRALINQGLTEVLPPEVHFPSEFQRAARYAVLGDGQRLRPLLALGAAEAFRMPAAPWFRSGMRSWPDRPNNWTAKSVF